MYNVDRATTFESIAAYTSILTNEVRHVCLELKECNIINLYTWALFVYFYILILDYTLALKHFKKQNKDLRYLLNNNLRIKS